MDAVNRPEKLHIKDRNISQQWKIWKKEFQIYLAALDVPVANDARRIALLLNMAGREAVEVSENFQYADGESAERYECVLQKFEEYCTPKANLVFERHKFFLTQQAPGETAEAYMNSIRTQATVASIKTMSCEECLKSVLMTGMKDKKLQKRLLKMPNVTLAGALEEMVIAEHTDKQWETLNPTENEAIGAVHRTGHGAAKGNGRQAEASGATPEKHSGGWGGRSGGGDRRSAKREEYDCRKCGTRHKARNCKAFNHQCSKCGLRGHYSRFCPKQVRIVDEAGSSGGEDDFYINVVQSEPMQCEATACQDQRDRTIGDQDDVGQCERPRSLDVNKENRSPDVNKEINHVRLSEHVRWTHALDIQGAIIPVKLDTGAGADLLNYNDYKALKNPPSLREPRTRLTDYNGGEITVKGECVATVMEKGRKQSVRFVVVHTGPSLLGAKTCERLGLVVRVFGVDTSEPDVKDLRACTLPEVIKPLSALPFVHKIVVREDCKPVTNAARRVPVAVRDKLKQELSRMIQLGVLEKVEEPTSWVNNLVVVYKPNGDLRLCLDPRDLNKVIVRERFQLPTRDEIFAGMAGARIFSKLDASQAFWQVKLSRASRHLTTFGTPFGRYMYTRLPYGLCSAPEVFHKTMEQMFEGIEGVRVYMDDILVWGKTDEEHKARLDEVKTRINKYNLLMNWEKCELGRKEVIFIGEKLDGEGVRPSAERVEAIVKMDTPTDREAVQRALGSINYVGKFVPNLAAKCANLRALMCKTNVWCWGPEHESEWQEIKRILASDPVLAYFDCSKETKVSTDASRDGLGAVLLQLHGSEWKPVAYGARSLTDSERRYAQIEKECLGLAFGCSKFHNFIFGLPKVLLETDHKPLVPLSLKCLDDMSPRIQRLMLKLQRYRYELSWTPGKYLYIADTLSRASSGKVQSGRGMSARMEAHVNMVFNTLPASKSQLARIEQETSKDESLCKVMRCMSGRWSAGQCLAYAPYEAELYMLGGVLMKGRRIVIPTALRKEMLALVHEGHLGCEKQKRLARSAMFWPGMNKDIEVTVQKCGTCNRYRPAQQKETLKGGEEKSQLEPWEKVGMDLFVWEGSDYLVIVDYHSNFPEVSKLANTRSETVVTHIKCVFARHGIPREVVSDNGTQFSSEFFTRFAAEYGFSHRTSSPRHPQANGQAERAVGIVKGLLNRAKDSDSDPYLALLAYRQAPREMGASPAELLMGRYLKSKLPGVSGGVLDRDEWRRRSETARKRVERNYNSTAKDLNELKADDVVRLREKHWDRKAIVLDQVNPRSYIIKTEDGGEYRRNRRDLLKVGETYEKEPQVEVEREKEDGVVKREKEDGVVKREEKEEEVMTEQKTEVSASVRPETVELRRSTRTRKPVQRTDL